MNKEQLLLGGYNLGGCNLGGCNLVAATSVVTAWLFCLVVDDPADLANSGGLRVLPDRRSPAYSDQ